MVSVLVVDKLFPKKWNIARSFLHDSDHETYFTFRKLFEKESHQGIARTGVEGNQLQTDESPDRERTQVPGDKSPT